jgi:hypothetical protein
LQRQAQIHHLAGKRDGGIEPLGSACDDSPVAQTVRICILAGVGEEGRERRRFMFAIPSCLFFSLSLSFSLHFFYFSFPLFFSPFLFFFPFLSFIYYSVPRGTQR